MRSWSLLTPSNNTEPAHKGEPVFAGGIDRRFRSGESDVENISSRCPHDGRQEGHTVPWAGHPHALILASQLNQNRWERSVWQRVYDCLPRGPSWSLELTFPPIDIGFVASANASKNGQFTLIAVSLGWALGKGGVCGSQAYTTADRPPTEPQPIPLQSC